MIWQSLETYGGEPCVLAFDARQAKGVFYANLFLVSEHTPEEIKMRGESGEIVKIVIGNLNTKEPLRYDQLEIHCDCIAPPTTDDE
jgi:hypothetical protein